MSLPLLDCHVTSHKDLAALLPENGIIIFHTLTRPLLESKQSRAMDRPTVYDTAGKRLVLGRCSVNAGDQQPQLSLRKIIKLLCVCGWLCISTNASSFLFPPKHGREHTTPTFLHTAVVFCFVLNLRMYPGKTG